MARSTKAAVLDETVEEVEVEAEATPKQIINEGIARVIDATGIDVQKNRYKAMRAIAYQAFLEAIEGDDFDGLVDRAIEGIDELPTGWEIEKAPAAEAAPVKATKAPAKTATKTAAKKAPAKAAPAKTSARKRPTR